MKKSCNLLMYSLIFFCFFAFVKPGMAQAPPPPPGEKGGSSNQDPASGAPIDGGLGILLALGAGYGAWKWVKCGAKKKQALEL